MWCEQECCREIRFRAWEHRVNGYRTERNVLAGSTPHYHSDALRKSILPERGRFASSPCLWLSSKEVWSVVSLSGSVGILMEQVLQVLCGYGVRRWRSNRICNGLDRRGMMCPLSYLLANGWCIHYLLFDIQFILWINYYLSLELDKRIFGKSELKCNESTN